MSNSDGDGDSACTTSATATLYSTQYSAVLQTSTSTGYINGSQIASPIVETSYVRQAFPTATLYGTTCQAIEVASTTTPGRNRDRDSSFISSVSTAYVPASTATYVRQSTAANNGGASIVYVTAYSTMSAKSVFVVYKTRSNVPAATSTANAAQTNTKSSSSSHAGAIAGGIVAAIVLIVLLAFLAWCVRKRSRRDRDTKALDDFFKDSLNPGEAGVGGALLEGTMSTNRSIMRRKSSQILDLEKEKNLSHSNDEDNWAALTRISTSIGGHEDQYVDCPSRSLSRLSLNAISRGASIRSYGADEALAGPGAGAVGWDGMADRPLVEEPESIIFPPASIRSRSSIGRSPYEDGHPRSAHRMSSHLTSHSNDHTPALSPALASMQSASTGGEASPHSEEGGTMFSPAPSPFPRGNGRPHARMQHHLSMSGLYPHARPAVIPSLASISQGIPERPKSALGIMAVPEPLSPRLRHPSLQQSPPLKPISLQSRASIGGYGQYAPQNIQYSPPLHSGPIRTFSAQQQRRPGLPPQAQFGSAYPPSRYSHLDIISPGAMAGQESEAPKAEAAQVQQQLAASRQRSLSGSILVKTAASLSEDAAVHDFDPSSSASASLKAPTMTRNSSPEQVEDCQRRSDEVVLQEKSPSVARTFSLLSASTAEEGTKRASFWQPQAWRGRVVS